MGKSSILTATLRIYDEDVAEKFEEIRDQYKKLTRYEEISKSRTLNFVIGLAYQRLQNLDEEIRSGREQVRSAEQEKKNALEFETK